MDESSDDVLPHDYAMTQLAEEDDEPEHYGEPLSPPPEGEGDADHESIPDSQMETDSEPLPAPSGGSVSSSQTSQADYSASTEDAPRALPKVEPNSYDKIIELAGSDVSQTYGFSAFELRELVHYLAPPPVVTWHDEIEGRIALLMLLRWLRLGFSDVRDDYYYRQFQRPSEDIFLAIVCIMNALLDKWRHLLDLLNAHLYYLTPENIEMLTWNGDGTNENLVSGFKATHKQHFRRMGCHDGGMVWGFLGPRKAKWLTMPTKTRPNAFPKPAEWPTIVTNSGLLYSVVGGLPDLPSVTDSHVSGSKRPVQKWLLKHSHVNASSDDEDAATQKESHKRAFLWSDRLSDRFGRVLAEVPVDQKWRSFLTPPQQRSTYEKVAETLSFGRLQKLFPIARYGDTQRTTYSGPPHFLLSDVYMTAMLLFNCKTCLSPDLELLEKYKRRPPALHQYLAPRHRHHVDVKLPRTYEDKTPAAAPASAPVPADPMLDPSLSMYDGLYD